MPTVTIELPKQKCRFLALMPGEMNKVVAFANDRETVLKKANKAGVKKPVIMPVLEPQSREIFLEW